MKKVLAERIVRHYAPARERYAELIAHPAEVDGILEEGADRLAPKAAATMDEVRERMGLR
jgi:tryptophanyl-tRNA synthetase